MDPNGSKPQRKVKRVPFSLCTCNTVAIGLCVWKHNQHRDTNQSWSVEIKLLFIQLHGVVSNIKPHSDSFGTHCCPGLNTLEWSLHCSVISITAISDCSNTLWTSGAVKLSTFSQIAKSPKWLATTAKALETPRYYYIRSAQPLFGKVGLLVIVSLFYTSHGSGQCRWDYRMLSGLCIWKQSFLYWKFLQ